MKVLCVAEKNSIAKAVSGILGGGRSKASDSPYKYVKNYNFTFDFGPQLGRCDVVMTSVAGHLTQMDFPSNFGWGKCDHSRVFDAPIEVKMGSKDQEKIARNIREHAKSCDVLMIWTDCDREGEYIGYEILETARKANGSMSLTTAWRAQFSHLEARHILQAARNPIRLDKNAIDAVGTRMEIDLRAGVSFTRMLTDLFRQLKDDVVSYGTCQFPTLGFVVDRYKRVKGFKSEEFWYIQVTVKKDDITTQFAWQRNHLFDRLLVTCLYELCCQHETATVVDLVQKPTKKWRPLPLTTVELQKNCSRFLKLSAKESLDAAEALYQKGFLSYPRTETDVFAKETDLQGIITKLGSNDTWGSYAKSLLQEDKFCWPRSGSHDDKAHPPIHPIMDIGNTGSLTVTQKKVYEYVCRHFLACCSNDAEGSSTTLTLKWGDEIFTASGLVVLARNYLDVYKYADWKTSKSLPKLEIGEEIKLSSTAMKDGKTSPPKHMTESELILLMDANGIGTDATIAEHIEKITSRNYIVKQKEGNQTLLLPTILGISLVDGFDSIGLANSLTKPFLRREMETDLKQVVEGTKNKGEVLNEMLEMYKESYFQTFGSRNRLIEAYRRVEQQV